MRLGVGWMQSYITKNCKDPAKSIQLFTYLLSEEGQILTTYGIDGETYKINEEGKYELLLVTLSEFCVGYNRFDDNQSQHANMYAHELIGNYNAGINNFVDWNICLNEEGGTNSAKNICSA